MTPDVVVPFTPVRANRILISDFLRYVANHQDNMDKYKGEYKVRIESFRSYISYFYSYCCVIIISLIFIQICVFYCVFFLYDFRIKQDNVQTNTESVQCISIVYSICPYKYNQ